MPSQRTWFPLLESKGCSLVCLYCLFVFALVFFFVLKNRIQRKFSLLIEDQSQLTLSKLPSTSTTNTSLFSEVNRGFRHAPRQVRLWRQLVLPEEALMAPRWVSEQEHPASGEGLLHHLPSIAISCHLPVRIGLQTLFLCAYWGGGKIVILRHSTFSKSRAFCWYILVCYMLLIIMVALNIQSPSIFLCILMTCFVYCCGYSEAVPVLKQFIRLYAVKRSHFMTKV